VPELVSAEELAIDEELAFDDVDDAEDELETAALLAEALEALPLLLDDEDPTQLESLPA
jgi:hypothetical protein